MKAFPSKLSTNHLNQTNQALQANSRLDNDDALLARSSGRRDLHKCLPSSSTPRREQYVKEELVAVLQAALDLVMNDELEYEG